MRNRIVRLLGLPALLGVLLVAVLGGSASAAPYPPANPPSLSASAYDPCAGAANTIGGTGFSPGETVRLVLSTDGDTLGLPVVRADGTFSITVTIPLSARGSGTVTATGETSGLAASLTLSFPCVLGQSAGVTQVGGLAYTGVMIGGAVVLGLLLVAGGALVLVAGRRRRTATTV